MIGESASISEGLKVIKTNIERDINKIKTTKIDKLQETIRLLRSELKCDQGFTVLIGYLFF